MRPVLVLTMRPGGRPMALKVSVLPSASEALAGTSTAEPTGEDWLPGLASVGGVLTTVAAAWRHCMPKLSIQLPERPYSAKPGLPESQRHGPCAVPVFGP